MQERIAEVKQLQENLTEAKRMLEAEIKLKKEAIKAAANKEITISNRDIEPQHVRN